METNTYALLHVTDRKNDHYVYMQTITLGIPVLVFHLHCILHVVLHLIGGFVAMYMYILLKRSGVIQYIVYLLALILTKVFAHRHTF